VNRGFEPGGGSSQQPAGPPSTYGPGGLQVRQQRNQEAVNRQQRLHNQGAGTPAAQVDFRTLNGQQDSIKPKDRKVKLATVSEQRATVGILGGQSSGSAGPMVVANTSTRPAPVPDTMDGRGTNIPRTADPAPAQAPSYNDLVGKLKAKSAPNIGPSRPRSRSPRRGDRRPLDVQRREGERAQRGGGVLFPGGDGREEAMARRSKTIPKSQPAREFYIGDGGTKRPGTPGVEQLRQATDTRKKRPNPAAGNQKLIGGTRKATSQPDDAQVSQPPPPQAPG